MKHIAGAALIYIYLPLAGAVIEADHDKLVTQVVVMTAVLKIKLESSGGEGEIYGINKTNTHRHALGFYLPLRLSFSLSISFFSAGRLSFSHLLSVHQNMLQASVRLIATDNVVWLSY